MTAIVQYKNYDSGNCLLTAISDTRESLGDFVISEEREKTKKLRNYIVSGSGSSVTFNTAVLVLSKYPVLPVTDALQTLAFLERIHNLIFRILERDSTGQLHFLTPLGIYTVCNDGVKLEDNKMAIHGSCYDKLTVAMANRTGTILEAFQTAIKLDIYCSDVNYHEVTLQVDYTLTPTPGTLALIVQSPIISAMGIKM